MFFADDFRDHGNHKEAGGQAQLSANGDEGGASHVLPRAVTRQPDLQPVQIWGFKATVNHSLICLNIVLDYGQVFGLSFPWRTFPQSIPAYMVCLENTLGAKQGTLFRAPRGSDRPVQDDNAFARCDYWNLLANKPQPPLNVGHSPTASGCVFWNWHAFFPHFFMCPTHLGDEATTWHQSRPHFSHMSMGEALLMLAENIFLECEFMWLFMVSYIHGVHIRTKKKLPSGCQHQAFFRAFFSHCWAGWARWRDSVCWCTTKHCTMAYWRRQLWVIYSFNFLFFDWPKEL